MQRRSLPMIMARTDGLNCQNSHLPKNFRRQRGGEPRVNRGSAAMPR
jgi:hypothetical protein